MDANPLPPAPPIGPTNLPQKNKVLKIVVIIVASIVGLGVIAGVVVIVLVTSAFSSFGDSCARERTSTCNSADQATAAFNHLTIIADTTGTVASAQKQPGDCVDSVPTV